MDVIKAKRDQVFRLLDELKTDCWMICVRETSMLSDPTLPIVVGFDVTWQSFFLFTRKREAIALVGNFDMENFRRSGRFTKVIPYTEGVKKDLVKVLAEIDPESIAVNFSPNDVASDGLTHGMYVLLQEYLSETPYGGRLVSSEGIVSKLRSRKLPAEIERLERAAVAADEVWQVVHPKIKPGMTEIEIGGLIDGEIAARGLTNSFETIVNAGSRSEPGHALPSEAKLAPGDLLHVDFGLFVDEYCSDIQRLMYLRRPGEHEPPGTLVEAFEMVREIITETAKECTPGVKGHEVDAVARKMLTDNGYPEYQHALGHQLGRNVHDGGGVIGPLWERYGETTSIPLEEGNVNTLELEIILPGTGCVGLEEDVCVTKNGARFLGPRQMELIIR